MVEYFTNPNKRCHICKGREVITVDDKGEAHTSLELIEGDYYCIDREECKQNIEAENTMYFFNLDKEHPKLVINKFGQNIFEMGKDVEEEEEDE